MLNNHTLVTTPSFPCHRLVSTNTILVNVNRNMAAIATVIMLITMSLASLVSALNVNYYENACPHNVDSIVAAAVHKATMNDRTVPAALLRMHFHDCFIRVCNFLLVLIQIIFIWGK